MSKSNKNIVDFVFELFDDSRYFLSQSKLTKRNETYLRASILTAWAGFEGWVNKTCLDFDSTLKDLTLLEHSFLQEKKIEFKKGHFELTNADKYESTENKLEFLITTIARSNLDKATKSWSDFQNVKGFRDAIVHPKLGRKIKFTINEAELTIDTLAHYLNLLSKKLYGNKLTV